MGNKIKFIFNSIETLLCLMFSLTLGTAQNESNAWIVGYGQNQNSNPKFGKTELNFKGNSLNLKYNTLQKGAHTDLINASIGDEKGSLLFFTEGLNIYGADQLIIDNGEMINPGQIWNDYSPDYYPAETNHVFLTSPNNKNEYYLFHISIEYQEDRSDSFRVFKATKFLYTKISVDSTTKISRVISKNNLIISGEFEKNHLAYCKHANGRDWWIIIEEYNSSLHYIFLLDKEGIKLNNIQKIGKVGGLYDWTGNSIFTPDGSKFIKYSYDYFVQIFDFDRCDGQFSNPIQLKSNNILNYKQSSIAISPNSRFLYVANYTKIWQFDLNSNDIGKSMDTIGTSDGFLFDSTLTTDFYQLALADDGKIYCSCYSSNIFLHVINNPNEKGLNCSFKLRDLKLPAWMDGGLPIMPNFSLGAIIGSSCDSLTLNSKQDVESCFLIYPNPCNIEITLKFNFKSQAKIFVDVYDLNGNKLISNYLNVNESISKINIDNLLDGIFRICVFDEKRKLLFSKLVTKI